jgi:hypothetical protein
VVDMTATEARDARTSARGGARGARVGPTLILLAVFAITGGLWWWFTDGLLPVMRVIPLAVWAAFFAVTMIAGWVRAGGAR